MNGNGRLLNVKEAREKIINGKTLILNPDANWNHKESKTKENYLLSYMAKNIYRLVSPVNSEYNVETREAGKTKDYVQLIPLDNFKQTPDKTESVNKTDNTKYIYYTTNN